MKYSTDGCIFEKSEFGIRINNKELNDFFLEKFKSLRNLEDYKKYPIRINMEIQVLGTEIIEGDQGTVKSSRIVDKEEMAVE